jgi:hypothetical protein
MAANMPLVKINDDVRINLFNVTRVEREKNGQVYVYDSGGGNLYLNAADSAVFLEYFDSFCENMHAALSATRRERPAENSESTTERDFGELVAPTPSEERAAGEGNGGGDG